MHDVIKLLKKLGLSSTETSLYLNGLTFKSVSVAKLVEMSQIKRTTAYHALNTLVAKGLAAESKQDGRLHYRMTPATELKTLLANRKMQIENQLVELEKIIPQFPVPLTRLDETPIVTNYYGTEGVHAAIDRALYCTSKEWRIMSPHDNFFRNSPYEYIEYFKRMRIERGIQARSLWERLGEQRGIDAVEIKRRQPRIMPASMQGAFRSTVIIFDENVLVVSSHSKHFATIIQSQETAQTFMAMFDAIWDMSEPVT